MESEWKLYGPYAQHNGWRCFLGRGKERVATPMAQTEEKARQMALVFLKKMVVLPRRTIGTVLDEYREYVSLSNKANTVETTFYRLRTLFPDRSKSLKSLTVESCTAAYMELVKRQKPDTHRNTLAVAKSFGNWCVERSLLTDNPFARIKPIGKRSRGKEQLTRDEARLWLHEALTMARAGDDGALVASMVLLMGLRPSEALLRTVRDIDDRGTRLRIRKAKTRAGDRDPKIPSVIRRLIGERCQGKRPDDLLFSTTDRCGKTVSRKPDWVLDAVRRICRRAGVRMVCAYSLRGLHADLAIEAGTVPDVVAQSLGHESSEMTMRHYAKPGTLADVISDRAALTLGVGDESEQCREQPASFGG